MRARVDSRMAPARSSERGQAALLRLGVLAAVVTGALMLIGIGQALGARGHAQRAADLAAISAVQVMRRDYPRLFEPPFVGGAPNPRYLSTATYLAHAKAAALRGARRNGVVPARVGVSFLGTGGGPGPTDFAPTRRVRQLARDARRGQRRWLLRPALTPPGQADSSFVLRAVEPNFAPTVDVCRPSWMDTERAKAMLSPRTTACVFPSDTG